MNNLARVHKFFEIGPPIKIVFNIVNEYFKHENAFRLIRIYIYMFKAEFLLKRVKGEKMVKECRGKIHFDNLFIWNSSPSSTRGTEENVSQQCGDRSIRAMFPCWLFNLHSFLCNTMQPGKRNNTKSVN